MFGHKGAGKSRWTKELIRKCLGRGLTVLVWDRQDEYTTHGTRRSDPVPGLRRWAARDGKNGLYRFFTEVSRGGPVPSGAIVAPDSCFPAFARWAYRQIGLVLVLDEADSLCSPTKLGPSLADLVRRGRHQRLDLVFVARGPSEVHRDVTRQADVEVYFRLGEGRDLDWLRRRGGKGLAERVRGLKMGQYLTRSW